MTKCITAAAHETLQVKQKLPLRKRNVSARTKQFYESRRRHFTTLSENERKEMSNAISKSGREDYREYVNGVLTESQLLKEWEQFLGAKFSRPESDSNRELECLVAEDDLLNDTELNECLDALRSDKAVGCDDVPVEAKRELFRLCRLMWHSERKP